MKVVLYVFACIRPYLIFLRYFKNSFSLTCIFNLSRSLKMFRIVFAIFALIQGISGKETSSCFDDLRKSSGGRSLTNGPVNEAKFYLTNYQGILRCAKTTSKDTVNQELFGTKFSKCLWLDNLDKCIQRWKESGIDCVKPFKN